ncbi:MAG: radical SAM protein [Bacteroidales bacterium]|nr:radical SAM protein [Bacteroidales bacterium]
MALQFDNIVFGPIHSRRLGSSLGVNLLPKHGKVCTFDCIYCECGWNKDGRGDTRIPPMEEVFAELETGIRRCHESGVPVDTITFSGNGEPTLHPDFPAIIDRTLELRAKYFSKAVVSVLTNATQIGRPGIREALAKVDNPILKLDAATDAFARLIDQPQDPCYSVRKIEREMAWFKGNFILQTMFLRGVKDGKRFDCTDRRHADAWVRMALRLHPREVMMYTLDRVPPLLTLEKVSVEEMQEIARPLVDAGILVQIKG